MILKYRLNSTLNSFNDGISMVLDLAEFIHKDFLFNLKFARVWGSAKFEGQRVEKTHVLKDLDIVEFHI
jgi:uncharacterized protein